MNETTTTRLGYALVIALACGVYLPALDAGFFSDDYQWLGRMNATLERPSYVFTVFFRDFNPVLHASFALDWIVAAADHPGVWHAHSLLLHMLVATLLLAVCRRRGAPAWIAVGAVALWAVNVRLSEAVIWPAARGHQLATVCSLAALLLVLGQARFRHLAAFTCLTLGLFAKETTFVAMAALPFFLPDWKRERRFLVSLAALAAFFVLLNVTIKGDLHTSQAGFSALLLKTPFLLLRPLGLADLYRFDFVSLGVVVLLFAGLAWILRRRTDLAGLIWVLACTAPVVPLDKLSSRYLYLPAVGYALIFCTLATRYAPLIARSSLRRIVPVALALLLLLLGAANVLRVEREIGDYKQLAAPYAALTRAFAPALQGLVGGQSLLVIDGAPQTTIRELTNRIEARGNMTKLIPYRRHAIDGLIELPDLLNVARDREPGLLGRGLDAQAPVERWFYYDGSTVREVGPQDLDAVPPQRIHRAAWLAAERYFD